MGLLDGKVAIITGASKGIGRALSLRFGREGRPVSAPPVPPTSSRRRRRR